MVDTPFRLLRDALWQLGLEADDQRRELEGAVVTDELALDLGHAVDSLAHAEEQAGVTLPEDVRSEVRRLADLLHAPPEDRLWNDESLDLHPTWVEARRLAPELLRQLPAT